MDFNITLVSSDMSDRSEERDLVERAKKDKAAFGKLYQCHYACIANYIYRRVGDAHLAEDLAADVFLSAFRSLSRFRYQGLSIRSWLYRIATNRVNRWARRERHRGHEPLVTDHADTRDQDREDSALAKDLARTALLTLAPKFQEVIALHHLEGMPVTDVAATLGCRSGTVKSRLARGRKALRAEIERRSKHEQQS